MGENSVSEATGFVDVRVPHRSIEKDDKGKADDDFRNRQRHHEHGKDLPEQVLREPTKAYEHNIDGIGHNLDAQQNSNDVTAR
jgi:hypothetical protein